MKLLIRPGQLMVLIPIAILLTGCSNPKANWRSEARAQAERDIAAGKLCLKTYGLPARWSGRYYTMAKEKYGVEFERVAGCLVNEELVERAKSYNEPMQQEINRRFGPNALEKLAEEAHVQYQEEQTAGPATKP